MLNGDQIICERSDWGFKHMNSLMSSVHDTLLPPSGKEKHYCSVPQMITVFVCLGKQSRCLVIWKCGAVFQRETDWRFMMMFSSTWPRKRRCAICI